jgi:hypothetical protein
MDPKILSGSVLMQSLTPTKVCIATPAYRSNYAGAYVESLFALTGEAPKHRVALCFSSIDYADVVTARNYLISRFYFNRTDCTHLLFLDSDMGFEAKLIFDMLALKQDVVGAIYPSRSVNLRKLHAKGNQPFEQAYAQACNFIGSPVGTPSKEPFVEVSGLGAGVLLISRAAVTKMIQSCPEIVDTQRYKHYPFAEKLAGFIMPFNKIDLGDKELSEDLSFCHRWRKACGGKIFGSTTSLIKHVGENTVISKLADSW